MERSILNHAHHPLDDVAAAANQRRLRRICLALFVATTFLVCFGDPLLALLSACLNDQPTIDALPEGMADDASRLNQTPVREIVRPIGDVAARERQLQELLARARREKLRVSIAGARHTMGGHTIYPGGLVLDMSGFDELSFDEGRKVLRAGAGVRWSQVLPFLDARGRSVQVMQSNNDFSVGGSLGANCHGWQHGRPPIASSIESLHMMTADGRIHRCSRTENREMFAAVLGGYGLLGVILDAELRTVPNELYRGAAEHVATSAFVGRFTDRARDAQVGMLYGRMNVAPGPQFLGDALIIAFRRDPSAPHEIPKLTAPPAALLRREVFRAQIGARYGKELRWRLETAATAKLPSFRFSRNQLFNESAEVYRERNADRTDILHEYFVPPTRFAEFIAELRRIIPAFHQDLLNVTVRHVLTDDDTLLRYVDQEMLSLVLLFNQNRTATAEADMRALTESLIEAALRCGGRYYLPYRLHATVDQFRRAYPQADEFFALKRKHDPEEVFQNQFYAKYGRAEAN